MRMGVEEGCIDGGGEMSIYTEASVDIERFQDGRSARVIRVKRGGFLNPDAHSR